MLTAFSSVVTPSRCASPRHQVKTLESQLVAKEDAPIPEPEAITDQRIAKEMMMLASENRQLRAQLEGALEEDRQVRESVDRMRELVQASADSRAVAVRANGETAASCGRGACYPDAPCL
jgi:hypothetical protein